MERFKIYGPPGTGKTTYLLSLLEQELESVKPNECAFVSFTKKGTYEGAQRATEKFNLSTKDLKYFKTIHAICFAETGTHKYDMLQRFHYKQFGEAMGMRFLGYYTEELVSNNDQYLFAEQLERNNAKAYDEFTRDLSIKKLDWVARNYRQFKKQIGVLDFTDLLTRYLKEGDPLPIKVAFVDEAQDLTTLQWQVIAKLFKNVERLYVAGDDDQAIYEWSGADVNKFLKFNGKTTVLSKSYRLPKDIHAYANNIAHEIRNRHSKEFSDNGEKGLVKITTSWKDIPLNGEEETLILSRNNCFLKEAVDELQDQGLVYTKKGVISTEPKTMAAINKYTDYTKGKVQRKDIALYSSYFKTIDEPDKPWFVVLNKDIEEINYYRMLIAKRTPLDKSNVALETIHSAKGSESDHVVLLMNITNRVFLNMQNKPDSELRCLYVGTTRAKKKLTIKLPNAKYGFPLFKPQEI